MNFLEAGDWPIDHEEVTPCLPLALGQAHSTSQVRRAHLGIRELDLPSPPPYSWPHLCRVAVMPGSWGLCFCSEFRNHSWQPGTRTACRTPRRAYPHLPHHPDLLRQFAQVAKRNRSASEETASLRLWAVLLRQSFTSRISREGRGGHSWGLGTPVTGGLASLPASFPGLAFATVSVAGFLSSLRCWVPIPGVLGSLLTVGVWPRVPVPRVQSRVGRGKAVPLREGRRKQGGWGGVEAGGRDCKDKRGAWLTGSPFFCLGPGVGRNVSSVGAGGSCSHFAPWKPEFLPLV